MTFIDRVDAVIRDAGDWIASRRWYGDKARSIVGVVPEMILPVDLPETQAALVVARIDHDYGDPSQYFIPLIATDDATDGPTSDFGDALRDEAFLAWMKDGFSTNRSLDHDGVWRWKAMDVDSVLATLDPHNARVLSAEQSNTSVVFGNKVVAKVFRRLQPGLNPDLEIGQFLTEHGNFVHAPRLYGLVDFTRDDEVIAIAAVQEFVANDGDGWEWMLRELATLDADSQDRLLGTVTLLGQRTGELHVALSAVPGDIAFGPEPFKDEDARLLNKRVIAEISDSVEGLAQQIDPDEVAAIHRAMGRLMSHAQTLVGTYRIRVHGDYHLGQTLRTRDGDFAIIDFEGEPSRAIAQRRAKQTALKDVAGMLRSLDYAVATVGLQAPDRHEVLDTWLTDAEERFVSAYREAVAAAPVPLVPNDDIAFREALELLIAEKALYETRYELNNRPDWIDIPLNALRRLAAQELA